MLTCVCTESSWLLKRTQALGLVVVKEARPSAA